MSLDFKEVGEKAKKARYTARQKALSIILGVFSFGAPIGAMLSNPKSAEAYTPNTHRFLSSQGLLLNGHDKGSAALSFFYEDNGAQLIMDYSTMPDFDENDGGIGVIGGFRGHFYDPATGKNFMGESNNTANTRFSSHYYNAVRLYKEGKKTDAWKELGRALHYYEDMNEPHHAANQPNLESPSGTNFAHDYFEVWAEKNQYNYVVNSVPQSFYDEVKNNTTWVDGHNAAVNAKNADYYVRSLYYALSSTNDRYAANIALPYAQKGVAAMLNKFKAEVGR